MKVIIAGGRDFNDYELLKSTCDHLLQNIESVEIVSGKARGADSLGEKYAKERGYVIHEFPADWSLGKKAGMIRNRQMGDFADLLIAYYDGVSLGTGGMIKYMQKLEKPFRIVKYDIKL